MNVMKLPDPAKDVAPVLDKYGNVDQAKTDAARRKAREKAWARAPGKPAQKERRQQRVDTAFAAMGGAG